MITIRKAQERGNTNLSWLESYHSFSFASYYDPKFMGFGTLLVINEDRVQPGTGFGGHDHSEMEIISYVISGAIEHKDNMGTGSVIRYGEIQRMSAGSGIRHSEFNPSNSELLHFLQIWIRPKETDLKPSYEQKTIQQEKNKLILIGSPKGGRNAIVIHQDVELFVGYLTPDYGIDYFFPEYSKGWVQLIKGEITINGQLLDAGDGASISEENKIKINCLEDAEFLLFDLRDISYG
ncbi:MAG: pirin family protein [Tatlockia sp.]|nr:pirin family protein [Tatlockia sp.]